MTDADLRAIAFYLKASQLGWRVSEADLGEDA